MTEVSDWKKIDVENVKIDNLSLSAPQGNYWQKIMGALARACCQTHGFKSLQVEKVPDETSPGSTGWELENHSHTNDLTKNSSGQPIEGGIALKIVGHDGIDVAISSRTLASGNEEVTVHLRLTPTATAEETTPAEGAGGGE